MYTINCLPFPKNSFNIFKHSFGSCATLPIKQKKSVTEQDFTTAYHAGNFETVQKIIDTVSFDPNVQLENGSYPLHFAIRKQAPKAMIQNLLKKGANPNAKDNLDLSATDHAILSKNLSQFVSIVAGDLHIDEKEATNVKENFDEIRKNMAKAHGSIIKAKGFLEINAICMTEAGKFAHEGKGLKNFHTSSLTVQDRYGMTPLYYAIRGKNRSKEEEKERFVQTIDTLIAATDNYTTSNAAKYSLLHFAVIANDPKILKKILDNVDKKDKEHFLKMRTLTGLSALHIALLEGHYDCATLLLKEMPELMLEKDQNGLTPLHIHLYNIFVQSEKANEKTGAMQFHDKVLLTLQLLVSSVQLTSRYIEVIRKGIVARSKLYYLRGTRGKAAKVKSRFFTTKKEKKKAPSVEAPLAEVVAQQPAAE